MQDHLAKKITQPSDSVQEAFGETHINMSTIMKADIFFFISSIATVVLAILLSIVLYYFIKAGRNLYQISEKLQDHFRESEEFVLELKERLEDNMLFRLFFPPSRGRKRAKEKILKKNN
ncbi:MAG: hypothetical protein UX75_C0003G0031 [Candidatus Moranbacteria bacterium GW2011_GWE2_47_10]|nr:MAG: hypothetical protein UX75_C0003G0031 [Candidatus Moranbacteria bacterium GW2011_GWE2_47_10]